MYRVILDNSLVLEGEHQPMGWDTITTVLNRDREKKGIIKTQEAKLRFHGVGYNYLLNIDQQDGFCKEVLCDIQEYFNHTWKTIHQGFIKIPNIVWNEKLKTAETSVEDRSFHSRINNNKNIADYPFGGRSKNGVLIDPAEFYAIEMFKPSDGTAYPVLGGYSLRGYRIYELFKWIIAYMSDGEIDFASDLFGVGGEYEGLALISGYVVFFKGANPLTQSDFEENHPKVSYEKLFNEVFKMLNIAFRIETVNNRPLFRIEKEEALFTGTNQQISFKDIDEIIRKTLTEEIYSVLKIGSDHIIDSPMTLTILSFASNLDWFGFKREDWTLEGQCNIDRPLDLQGEFIRDSNIIEDIIVNSNPDYKDKWIFVETTYVDDNNGTAIKGEPLGAGTGPPFVYNVGLRNSELANNFLSYIPNSVVQFLSQNTGGTFNARKQTQELLIPSPLPPPPFPTEPLVPAINNWKHIIAENDNNTPPTFPPTFDDGNNYDPVTGFYTVPFNSIYTFNITNVLLETFNDAYKFYLLIGRFSGGTTLENYQMISKLLNLGLNLPMSLSATFICNAGDIIRFYYYGRKDFGDPPQQILWWPGTRLKCSYISESGGEVLSLDSKNYRATTHEFKDYPVSKDEFDTIESNQTQAFEFGMYKEKEKSGYIKSIKYRHKERKADIVLISNSNGT